jgi:hypothetical protein
MRMTRNEVGAPTFQVGNFRASPIQSRTCTKCWSLVSSPQEVFVQPNSERQETLCRTGWTSWRRPLSTKLYKSWPHDIRVTLIYMATMCRSSLMWVPTCCIKYIFKSLKKIRATNRFSLCGRATYLLERNIPQRIFPDKNAWYSC